MNLRLIRSLALGGVLFGVWLLWSGLFKPLLISFGVLSVLAVVGIVARMGLLDPEGVPLGLPLRSLRYLPWLAWEIAKVNVDVARRVLSPRMPIRPSVLRVKAGQRHDLGRAIYANSITLTPGTVSIDVEGDEIVVHALTTEAADGLRSGEMDRRVTRFEGES